MDRHNGKMDRQPINVPPGNAEYERLVQILASLPGQDAMNLEEMDGFFVALICSPNLVPFGRSLPEIWGGGDTDSFAESIDPEELFGLVLRHWNYVSSDLDSSRALYIPRLETLDGEKFPRGNRWARGFVRGVEL